MNKKTLHTICITTLTAFVLAVSPVLIQAAEDTPDSATKEAKSSEKWAEEFGKRMEKWAKNLDKNMGPWAKELKKMMQQWSKQVDKKAEPWSEEFEKKMKSIAKELKKSSKQIEPKMNKLAEDMEKIAPHIKKTVQHIMEMIQHMDLDFDLPTLPVTPPSTGVKHPQSPVVPSPPEFNVPGVPPVPNTGNVLDKFKGETVTETVQQSVEVAEGTELIVSGVSSMIQIQPGDSASTITLSALKTAGAKTREEAKALLDHLDISINKTDQQVEVTTNIKQPEEENDTMAFIEMMFMVPKGTPVTARNSFGGINILNVGGPVNCENSFGSTRVIGSEGSLNLTTYFGSTKVGDHTGDATIQNKFGNLTINGLDGDLNINVSYGQAEIKDIDPDVHIEGKCAFGKFELVLPEDYAGSIEASVKMGSIEVPEELTMHKEMTSQSVSGTLGDGTGKIRIVNQYGPLIIKRG